MPGTIQYPSLSQVPRPDLSYSTLDGLVDFGTTKLKVEVPADGDSFETKLKGRVAMTGGVCSKAPCPLQIMLVELTSVQDEFWTTKGKHVSGLFARNVNTWTGTRLQDGTIIMDPTNKLALEANVNGERRAAFLDPNPWFKGALYYNVTRSTDAGPRVNNRIAVSGSFANHDAKASLDLSIWATDCQPVVHPSAQCNPAIEAGDPGQLLITSTFERLGNLQASQDLCDALLVPDPTAVCTAGGDPEFPTFTCKKQPLAPATTPAEVAKQLAFRWTDATGATFSTEYEKVLHWTPMFPIRLTVENKWHRVVDAEVKQAAQAYNCPRAMEYTANRPSSDYRSFDLALADPALCQVSCDGEAKCKAWTYVKPSIQHPKALCWLKQDVPKVTPNACCVSGVKGMEYLIDRSGSDYKSFDLGDSDPALCRSSCDGEAACKAWTYVKPGAQGPKARCWLKHDVPKASPDACCVSGVKGMEYATNRQGSDYRSFDLAQADPALCRASCTGDAKCKAWTYVKPSIQHPKALCWLKQDVPAAKPSSCCISGIK